MSSDHFSDLLQEGESIQAVLAGAGPAEPGAGEYVWIQLALTAERLLVVRLSQSGMGGWRPTHRFGVGRHQVRLGRFPHTPRSPARIEVRGRGLVLPIEPVQIVGIDDPNVFPHVDPFLQAWGGPLEGVGEVRMQEGPGDPSAGATDFRKLILVAVLGLGILSLCCCGSVVVSFLSDWLPNAGSIGPTAS